MNAQRSSLFPWSWTMRILALLMGLNLFMLPQMATGQSIIAMCEESGSPPPGILEEEVIKPACPLRRDVQLSLSPEDEVVLLHQLEQLMLDHPLLEVPHQPPKRG